MPQSDTSVRKSVVERYSNKEVASYKANTRINIALVKMRIKNMLSKPRPDSSKITATKKSFNKPKN